jgi:hypothetical protein
MASGSSRSSSSHRRRSRPRWRRLRPLLRPSPGSRRRASRSCW